MSQERPYRWQLDRLLSTTLQHNPQFEGQYSRSPVPSLRCGAPRISAMFELFNTDVVGLFGSGSRNPRHRVGPGAEPRFVVVGVSTGQAVETDEPVGDHVVEAVQRLFEPW